MTATQVVRALAEKANADDAEFLQRFFKTGKGQYGEGDVFIGIRVPATRAICKEFRDLPLAEIQLLLDSPIHEHRLAGVIIMTYAYSRATAQQQKALCTMYLKNVHAGRVNNWDLVDVSAPLIVGPYLVQQNSWRLLQRLAKSNILWERRVAMLSTFAFLKQDDPEPTITIAELLLHDKHDLIQKAVGWLLREMGKRVDEALLVEFLNQHAKTMPRTTLRYAIERLSPAQKKHFMQR